MSDKHIDDISGVETTGHEWDGIRELNNPMPRWWVWTFYMTILWAIGYTIAFPAWPLISGSTQGLLGWHSRSDFVADSEHAKAAQNVYLDKIASSSLENIQADSELMQLAVAGGAAAFKINCVQCHGSGAEGGNGYPNLNDDDWLWGGTANDIYTTITHGIRFTEDADTRISEMPAFGEMLKSNEIREVAAYVVSLTGTARDASMVEPGARIFADNCASCHGDDAKGNRDMGAPNLADAIWLKAHGEDGIVAQIRMPKHGVMPAWGERLSDTTVKQLTLFVHSLGGGE
ncbi:cytochrome-c oxidase, cbb3-type subunit III [Agrobacterium bohemicum]|uniref:Cbb3-type cytochrome c oxidase subunit n=1 Tax=Agrobacterium bohemicum TaxID=2052828 RepID=A0A135P5F6_9HYPH|nr:cytochrome-c oxidase, cbb3-type subunit III [Agrobacterium bohemicum]KXG86578.1 cytochrome C oxidase Cbb3 [Agrobacterium bohemicum]